MLVFEIYSKILKESKKNVVFFPKIHIKGKCTHQKKI